MILFYSNVRDKPLNTSYPHKIEIKSLDDLRKAASFDYVGVEYKDDHRCEENFLVSDCLMLDLDNDHSEDPSSWIDVNTLLDFFPGVEVYIHYSQNHQKIKKGKPPGPKYHLLFPINKMTD